MDAVEATSIVGTLTPSRGDSTRVGLFANNLEVDHVDVPAAAGDSTHFRFALKDLWRYLGPQDRISVRVGGASLAMPGGTSHYSPKTAGPETVAALAERLRGGDIVNSQGVLARPKYLDAEWQSAATVLHGRIHDALREVAGYDSFLIYGSLLGAVREGRPLGHDYDFDSAYLSRHTDPDLVREEIGQIAVALQERGFAVEARLTCIHVSDQSRKLRVDLYHLFFDERDELRLAWGAASDIPFRRQQWQGTEEIEFAGASVLIPRNAAALVETLYGPNWQIPNPGFDWSTERKTRAPEAYFPAALRPVINWQDYWQHAVLDAPSAFARTVIDSALDFSLVVDLGCGDGRDVPKFVRSGARVIGLDQAPSAIASSAGRRIAPDRVSFAVADFRVPGEVSAAVGREGGKREKTLFYARHLFDSITSDLQDALLSEIEDLVRPGDAVAFEFRGLQDETLTAHELRSVGRRVVDAQPIRAWIARAGLDVVMDDEGTQWEVRGSKRVYLHRLIARRPA